MKEIKSRKSRIFSLILAFAMVLSFYVGFMPLGIASAEVSSDNFNLTWNDGTKNLTVDTQGNSNDVSVTAHIYYHASGTFNAKSIKITIPNSIAWGRNGEKAVLSDAFKTGLPNTLTTSTEGDKIVITNSTSVTAPTFNIFPSYKIDPINVKSGTENSLEVSVESEGNDYQQPISGSKTIKCKIKTQINSITTNKKKVSSDSGISGLVTTNGQMRKWSNKALTNYGYTEEEFNSDKNNYNIVEYRSELETEGNQPYRISIQDTPDNSGVVIGAYASGIVSGKMSKNGDKFVLDDVLNTYTNDSKKQYVYVLVKYPKENSEVHNRITAYATGIDDNITVHANAMSGYDKVSSDAIYEGNVWGIKKSGIAENESGGLTILENGQDKNISFWIYPAIAHTYNYGVFENGEFVDKHNGPYKVETTDDVMYLSSGSEGITKRLNGDDYEFTSIRPYVKDKKIAQGTDSDGLPNLEDKPSSERPDVKIYSRTQVNGEWKLDGIASLKKEVAGDYYEYNEVSVQQGAIQVKVSYDGSWGDTLIKAQVFGKLKHNGKNVKDVVNNAKSMDKDQISLINWANIQGFDKDGNWLNVTSEKNIPDENNLPFVKSDLLEFDQENYTGHSKTDDKQSQRATCISKLRKINLYTGAADGVSVTGSSSLNVKYNLFAMMTADARSLDDMKQLVESKSLYNSKKAVFYDLLPKGVEYLNASQFSSAEINDPAYKDETSKNFHPEGRVNFNFPKPNTNNFAYYETNKINKLVKTSGQSQITAEVVDNYKNTGRQLVKLTIDYTDVPIGYIGAPYKIYCNYYGAVLNAKTTPQKLASSQSNIQHDNLFAAQFYDEDGKTICNLENYHNSNANDGLYYGGYQEAFSGLGNGELTDKTVVYAPSYFSYQPSASQTGINLAIKADDYDFGFKTKTYTLCGKDYTYRLSYHQDLINSGEAGRKDIVLFDTLETYTGTKWQGTLKGFDTTEANQLISQKYPGYKGITIYVNNNEISDSDYQTQGKVTADVLRNNADGWRVYHENDDLSEVKSVAFMVGKDIEFKNDLSNFNVYIKMKAPDKIENTSWSAFNNMAYYSEINSGDKSTNVGEKVQISLKNTYFSNKINVVKEITGEQRPTEKDFTFTIKGDKYVGDASEINAETMPMPEERNITVNKQNNWTNFFGKITYYKEGDYYYTITENQPESGYSGYTFDTTVHKIRVHVYNPNGKGATPELKYEIFEDDNSENVSVAKFTFINNYKPVATDLTLNKVVKKVQGDKVSKSQVFKFKIKGENNAPMPSNDTIEITINDNSEKDAKFQPITYDKTGTYNYKISEVAENTLGYTYDISVYNVQVQVTDNDGKLKAEASVTKDGQIINEDEFKFINSYKVTPTSINIPVKKTVKGDVPENSDKTFNFEISGKADEPMPANSKISIKGSGENSFENIEFTKAGTYEYIIKEENTKENGYTYDNSEYNVTVKVADVDSKLKATYSITKNNAEVESIEFVNTYKVTSTSINIPVKKTVKGDVPENSDKTFNFEISGKADEPMPANSKISIKGSGENSFENIEFTKAGTYEYIIKEENTKENGYTYDNSEYNVTVKVADVDSKLKATYSITKNNAEVESIEFVNTYTPTTPSQPDSSSKPDTPSQPDSSSKPDTPSQPDSSSKPDTPSQPDSSSKPDTSSQPDSSQPDDTAYGFIEDEDSDEVSDNDDSDNSTDDTDKEDESSAKDKDTESSEPENNGGDNANTGAAAVPGVILTAVLAAICINRRKKFDDENDDE